MPNLAKYVLSFVLGALCVTAYAWFVLKPNMQRSIAEQQKTIAQLTTQHDTCKAKFARATILYERPVNIFGQPIDKRPALRVWAVGADVEPVYVGTGEGFFTHYDPKSQDETVQLPAKKK